MNRTDAFVVPDGLIIVELGDVAASQEEWHHIAPPLSSFLSTFLYLLSFFQLFFFKTDTMTSPGVR